jgi:hypothetical protein
MTYSDVMNMPTYERRFFIRTYTEQIEKHKEQIEESEKNKITNTKKGERIRRVSGNSVKDYSGKI